MFDENNKFSELTDQSFGINTYSLLKMHTVNVPNFYDNPGRHIYTHMEYLKKYYPNVFKYTWGFVFEKLVADSIINFIDTNGDRITIKSLDLNKRGVRKFERLFNHNVDIDILFNDIGMILAKTSLRERWKQADRDMSAITRFYENTIKKYFIFFREYDHSSPQDAIQQAKNLRSKMLSDANLLTVYDEEGMYKTYSEMVKGV